MNEKINKLEKNIKHANNETEKRIKKYEICYGFEEIIHGRKPA